MDSADGLLSKQSTSSGFSISHSSIWLAPFWVVQRLDGKEQENSNEMHQHAIDESETGVKMLPH
jgi:hypothetical protein